MGEQKTINASQFLRQYESKNTKSSYKTGLTQFFKMIYPESDEDLDTISERYLAEDRDHREDLLNFRESLKDKSPKTKALRFNAIRVFLSDNEINFPRRFYKNLNGKSVEPITWEKIPSNEDLRRIIEYLPVQGKALALVLSSSGMRIGESVKIKISDVEFDREITRIKIRADITKTGKRRITFLSHEAQLAVEEWLKYREQYIDRGDRKGRTWVNEKPSKDNLFPFRAENFNIMWKIALKKAGLFDIDEKTKRMTMRPHNLRKFFRLIVGRHGTDEAEALMGHQTGLNAIYARFVGESGNQRLEEIYKKAIPDLSVYGRTIQIAQVDEETIEKISKLEHQVGILVQERAINQAEIRVLQKRVDLFEEHIDNVIKGKFEIFEKREAQMRKEWEEAKPTEEDIPEIK